MAKKIVNDKEVTKTLKVLNFEKGIAIIDGDSTEKERELFLDEAGAIAIKDSDEKNIYITDWDLDQHGLIDEELEELGLESSYDKYAAMIGIESF